MEEAAINGVVTFERDDLLRAFRLAVEVSPPRAAIQTDRLGALYVSPAGVTLGVRAHKDGLWLDIALDPIGEWTAFEAFVPVRYWLRALSAMDRGAVTIRRDGDVVALEQVGMKLRYSPGYEPRDLPTPPTFDVVRAGVADGWDLVRVFRMASRVASTDESRPVMASVYLTSSDGVRWVVASDGYRLVRSPIAMDGDLGDVLVPVRAARAVARLTSAARAIGVTIGVSADECWLQFEVGPGCMLRSRAVLGTYPQYEHLIPTSYDTEVTLPAAAMLRALGTMRHQGVTRLDGVRMRAGSAGFEVEVKDEDSSVAALLSATVEGPRARIAANWRYLRDALLFIDGDVRIELPGDSSSQMVFRPVAEPDCAYVLMPMFVAWEDETAPVEVVP